MWLDTVRIARDLGDVSALLPEGMSSLADAPYPLHDAISAALHFLKYQELPEDEQPPKRIWFDGAAMKEWIAHVERLREAKMKGEKPTGKTESNDLAEDILVG